MTTTASPAMGQTSLNDVFNDVFNTSPAPVTPVPKKMTTPVEPSVSVKSRILLTRSQIEASNKYLEAKLQEYQSAGLWTFSDRVSRFDYVPSDPSLSNPTLEEDEEKRWIEMVDEFDRAHSTKVITASEKHNRARLKEMEQKGVWTVEERYAKFEYVPSKAALLDTGLKRHESNKWTEMVWQYDREELRKRKLLTTSGNVIVSGTARSQMRPLSNDDRSESVRYLRELLEQYRLSGQWDPLVGLASVPYEPSDKAKSDSRLMQFEKDRYALLSQSFEIKQRRALGTISSHSTATTKLPDTAQKVPAVVPAAPQVAPSTQGSSGLIGPLSVEQRRDSTIYLRNLVAKYQADGTWDPSVGATSMQYVPSTQAASNPSLRKLEEQRWNTLVKSLEAKTLRAASQASPSGVASSAPLVNSLGQTGQTVSTNTSLNSMKTGNGQAARPSNSSSNVAAAPPDSQVSANGPKSSKTTHSAKTKNTAGSSKGSADGSTNSVANNAGINSTEASVKSSSARNSTPSKKTGQSGTVGSTTGSGGSRSFSITDTNNPPSIANSGIDGHSDSLGGRSSAGSAAVSGQGATTYQSNSATGSGSTSKHKPPGVWSVSELKSTRPGKSRTAQSNRAGVNGSGSANNNRAGIGSSGTGLGMNNGSTAGFGVGRVESGSAFSSGINRSSGRLARSNSASDTMQGTASGPRPSQGGSTTEGTGAPGFPSQQASSQTGSVDARNRRSAALQTGSRAGNPTITSASNSSIATVGNSSSTNRRSTTGAASGSMSATSQRFASLLGELGFSSGQVTDGGSGIVGNNATMSEIGQDTSSSVSGQSGNSGTTADGTIGAASDDTSGSKAGSPDSGPLNSSANNGQSNNRNDAAGLTASSNDGAGSGVFNSAGAGVFGGGSGSVSQTSSGGAGASQGLGTEGSQLGVSGSQSQGTSLADFGSGGSGASRNSLGGQPSGIGSAGNSGSSGSSGRSGSGSGSGSGSTSGGSPLDVSGPSGSNFGGGGGFNNAGTSGGSAGGGSGSGNSGGGLPLDVTGPSGGNFGGGGGFGSAGASGGNSGSGGTSSSMPSSGSGSDSGAIFSGGGSAGGGLSQDLGTSTSTDSAFGENGIETASLGNNDGYTQDNPLHVEENLQLGPEETLPQAEDEITPEEELEFEEALTEEELPAESDEFTEEEEAEFDEALAEEDADLSDEFTPEEEAEFEQALAEESMDSEEASDDPSTAEQNSDQNDGQTATDNDGATATDGPVVSDSGGQGDGASTMEKNDASDGAGQTESSSSSASAQAPDDGGNNSSSVGQKDNEAQVVPGSTSAEPDKSASVSSEETAKQPPSTDQSLMEIMHKIKLGQNVDMSQFSDAQVQEIRQGFVAKVEQMSVLKADTAGFSTLYQNNDTAILYLGGKVTGGLQIADGAVALGAGAAEILGIPQGKTISIVRSGAKTVTELGMAGYELIGGLFSNSSNTSSSDSSGAGGLNGSSTEKNVAISNNGLDFSQGTGGPGIQKPYSAAKDTVAFAKKTTNAAHKGLKAAKEFSNLPMDLPVGDQKLLNYSSQLKKAKVIDNIARAADGAVNFQTRIQSMKKAYSKDLTNVDNLQGFAKTVADVGGSGTAMINGIPGGHNAAVGTTGRLFKNFGNTLDPNKSQNERITSTIKGIGEVNNVVRQLKGKGPSFVANNIGDGAYGLIEGRSKWVNAESGALEHEEKRQNHLRMNDRAQSRNNQLANTANKGLELFLLEANRRELEINLPQH